MSTRDRSQRLDAARDALLRAASLLTELRSDENVAQAGILAAIGLVHIEAADTDGAVTDKMLTAVSRFQSRTEQTRCKRSHGP